jgi:hypothetical protein
VVRARLVSYKARTGRGDRCSVCSGNTRVLRLTGHADIVRVIGRSIVAVRDCQEGSRPEVEA